MKHTLFLFLVACAGCSPIASVKHALTPEPTCAIIHEPKHGCPAGYAKEKKPRFTEKDGSREFACVDQTNRKEQCIDQLRPGEGMGVTIEIRPGVPIETRPETPNGGPVI